MHHTWVVMRVRITSGVNGLVCASSPEEPQCLPEKHPIVILPFLIRFQAVATSKDIFFFKNCKAENTGGGAWVVRPWRAWFPGLFSPRVARASYDWPRIHIGSTRVIQGTNAMSRSPARSTAR
jgi:hypothetical protein